MFEISCSYANDSAPAAGFKAYVDGVRIASRFVNSFRTKMVRGKCKDGGYLPMGFTELALTGI